MDRRRPIQIRAVAAGISVVLLGGIATGFAATTDTRLAPAFAGLLATCALGGFVGAMLGRPRYGLHAAWVGVPALVILLLFSALVLSSVYSGLEKVVILAYLLLVAVPMTAATLFGGWIAWATDRVRSSTISGP